MTLAEHVTRERNGACILEAEEMTPLRTPACRW